MYDPDGLPCLESLRPVGASFFERDPRHVAPDLLGMLLVSTAEGMLTGGRIVETEAYLGCEDPGSHAATRGITKRNTVMYGPPGSVYVYFTYGNHYMLNLVCCAEGMAGAVLIRAIEPLIAIDPMRDRREGRPLHELSDGPGKVAKALGVDRSDNGSMVGAGRLVVYHSEVPLRADVAVTGRVGLSSGHDLEYRYYVRDNPFLSRGRIGPSRPRARGRAQRKER
jgi:DNA-3-methyladenine glycosylase